MRVWAILMLLAVAAVPAQAQNPAVVVQPGEVLEVTGPCDGEAVLSSLSTITILGTVRAVGTGCDPDPTRDQAPSGPDLIIQAPLIVLGDDGRIEGAHGHDGAVASLPIVQGTHTAQAGGDGGDVILRAPVSNYAAVASRGVVILGDGGNGADILCDGVACVAQDDAFIVTLIGGRGGDAGELIMETATQGVSSDGGRGGDGGTATARLEAHAPADAGADGFTVRAQGGDGGEGRTNGGNGNGGNATAYAPNGRTGFSGQDGARGQDGGAGGDAQARPGEGGGNGAAEGLPGTGWAEAGNGGHGGHALADPCSNMGSFAGHGGSGGVAKVFGSGNALGGTGGNGGSAYGKNGHGGDGGDGGAAQVWFGTGSAAGGFGGHGGEGQDTPGAGGLGGEAQQLGDASAPFVAEPGNNGEPGLSLAQVACEDITPPPAAGEPPINGEVFRSEPAPGQLVGLLLALLACALVARHK